MTGKGDRPKVLVLIGEWLYPQVIEPEVDARLDALADVVRVKDAGFLSPAAYKALFADVDAVITSWGTPFIDLETLDSAPRLRFIGHAAGSIRPVLPRAALERGLTVVNAAGVMAKGVAEMVLLFALASLRRLIPLQTVNKPAKRWAHDFPFEGLYEQNVGLIGFGQVGRTVVQLLAPFQCRFRVFDPYLQPSVAAAFNVSPCSLNEVLRESRIISLHAGLTPETAGMIGEKELALLRDGAVFINTARGGLVDHAALAKETARGRIQVCIDVAEPEPLPPDSPLWERPNVMITPHISGPTEDRRIDMGRDMVAKLEAFLSGDSPNGVITPKQYDLMT